MLITAIVRVLNTELRADNIVSLEYLKEFFHVERFQRSHKETLETELSKFWTDYSKLKAELNEARERCLKLVGDQNKLQNDEQTERTTEMMEHLAIQDWELL